MMLKVTSSFRMEVEKQFGRRLDRASVDDLLILAHSSYKDEGQTLYDIDVVLHIVANFLQFVEEGEAEWWDGATDDESVNREIIDVYESDSPTKHPNCNHKQNQSMVQVSKLMDSFLAEIGS